MDDRHAGNRSDKTFCGGLKCFFGNFKEWIFDRDLTVKGRLPMTLAKGGCSGLQQTDAELTGKTHLW
jgi:hypothetical protein